MEKRFLTNIVFSGLAHFVNVFFPLVYIPIVLPLVGLEGIGFIGLATSLASILSILIDHSFALTGVRDVIECHRNRTKESIVLSRIFCAKLLLLIASLLLYFPIVEFIPLFNKHTLMHYLTISILIGQALSVNFFFQAHENFFANSLSSILSKLIALAFILALVKEDGDYVYVPFSIGIGLIVANLITIGYLVVSRKLRFHVPRTKRVIDTLRQGMWITASNLAISVYMQGNIFFVGIFASGKEVGFYNIAEKIIMGIRQLLSIFSTIIYPKLYKEVKEGLYPSKSKINLYFKLLYMAIASVILVVCLLSKPVLEFVSKTIIDDIFAFPFRIFSLAPLIVAFNILPYLLLNITGYQKIAQKIILFGAVLSLLLNVVLGHWLSFYGIIISILVVELFITLSLRFYLRHTEKHKNELLSLQV